MGLIKKLSDSFVYDFTKKHNIDPTNLCQHIKNIITYGNLIKQDEKILANGKIGFEKIYCYKNKYYAIGAIGTNGFIVSMYPIDKGE